MKNFKLAEMKGGWIVGGFTPTAYSTLDCEVAVKHYKAGDKEGEHYHKIATEITCIVSGEVIMCGKRWIPGDIIVLSPGDITSFESITDAVTTVVKIPGSLNDKYII